MEGLTIRRFAAADTPAVARLVRDSPLAASWVPEGGSELPAWVAEIDGEIAGFVVARMAADELEILNVAVLSAHRRRGIGACLLREALAFGRRSSARRAFLEVRESNRHAQSLYLRLGFAFIGRRPRFYRDPEQDALLMSRVLDPVS